MIFFKKSAKVCKCAQCPKSAEIGMLKKDLEHLEKLYVASRCELKKEIEFLKNKFDLESMAIWSNLRKH